MSFVGGKLSLKGGQPLKASGGVKKKKKKAKEDNEDGGGDKPDGSEAKKKALDGVPLEPPPEGADRRTEAQKRHDERVAKLEAERLRKAAAKGYRDRVKEFNEHLASLSEHHDIPKVGPG